MSDDTTLPTQVALLRQQMDLETQHTKERADRHEARFDRDLKEAKAELAQSIDRQRGELSLSISALEIKVDRRFSEQQKHMDEKFGELKKTQEENFKALTDCVKELSKSVTVLQTDTGEALARMEGGWHTLKTAAKIAAPIIAALASAIGWLVSRAHLFG